MSDAPKFRTFRDLRTLPLIKTKEPYISSSTSIPSTPSAPETSRIDKSVKKQNFINKEVAIDVSPARDFQKVPNSVSRSLDMFRGKSKQVWDYLWSVSRGSINPTRTVRKSRKEIKEGSGLGSMVTVDSAIEHLVHVGLLKVNQIIGSLAGNEYEIFTPEEMILRYTTSTSISSSTSNTSLTQKVDILDILESSISSITQVQENKEIYSLPKTSLKTNTKNDDEAFAEMNETLAKVAEKIVGSRPTKNQKKEWNQLAELIAMELEIAAARTKTVSNIPAFLTEHLRRRLIKKTTLPKTNKSSLLKNARKTVLIDPDVSTPESLTEESRKSTLGAFNGYIEKGQRDFIMSLQETYTEEDWKWLINNLRKT